MSLLAAAGGLLAGWLLRPFLGEAAPYVTLLPATAFAAAFGMGPSLLGVVCGVLGTQYWFFPPVGAFAVADARQALALTAFLLASGIIVALSEASRRKTARLRRAQRELDEQVRQRTEELDAANQNLRELTARLLQLQDEERRRIARELHDSAGQTLAALAMNLAQVKADLERATRTIETVALSTRLVHEMSENIRTMSYLLHPPLLDETGLWTALRWYVEGFAERSGIQVELDFPEDFGRLPQEMEIAIFRVVQECLTNIHRHSGSATARVRASRSAEGVRVEVRDEGAGIPAEKRQQIAAGGTPGVGIRGMRERMRQLGGSLEISAGPGGIGTVVVVEVPLAAPAAGEAAKSAAAT